MGKVMSVLIKRNTTSLCARRECTSEEDYQALLDVGVKEREWGPPCSAETIGASDNVQKRIHDAEKDKILFNSNYYSFSTLSGQDWRRARSIAS
ncbi:hypothetical protein DVH05_010281 [Phytophthora capsici]|nr:hypothetical protein DVH05_010281 [Phytophthora capsici]